MSRSEASRTLVMRPARAAGVESSAAGAGATQAKSASRTAAEAKLAMAEFLLVREDLSECAERALDWLQRHAGVDKALCLAVDPSQKQLITLATLGLGDAEPNVSLDL